MPSTDKIDLFKQHKDQYASPKKPALIKADKAKYLAIEGRGAPGGDEFGEKIGALYAIAYTVKMTRKAAGLQDYVICKLETQYWFDGEDQNFDNTPHEQWNWRFMIRTPDMVKAADIRKAAAVLIDKGKSPNVNDVELQSISEGQCVQMLHVGPYDKEGETVEVMEAFAAEQGLEFHGMHHEIYLSDPRRVEPERLKTILRHPVRKRKG